MDYYLAALLDVWNTWGFELFWLSMGLLCMRLMEIMDFQRPHDVGYFSLHTKGSKKDFWHDSKNVAILCFGMAAIGEDAFLYLINNPIIQLAFLAWLSHPVYLFMKVINRIFSKTKQE